MADLAFFLLGPQKKERRGGWFVALNVRHGFLLAPPAFFRCCCYISKRGLCIQPVYIRGIVKTIYISPSVPYPVMTGLNPVMTGLVTARAKTGL